MCLAHNAPKKKYQLQSNSEETTILYILQFAMRKAKTLCTHTCHVELIESNAHDVT